MAAANQFICNTCNKAIVAWSDSNPYYMDSEGKKHYAYHPDPRVELRIGNDSPHLCLGCGEEFMVDSENPAKACPGCGGKEFVDTFELEGQTCPYCKKGTFEADPGFCCIS
jgi:DNA-directed RNA polymerase subunit RPC12/RpoP